MPLQKVLYVFDSIKLNSDIFIAQVFRKKEFA